MSKLRLACWSADAAIARAKSVRVHVHLLTLCVAATALGACSTYSRYEHEEQLRQESRQRWRDEAPDRRRARPMREASDRRAPAHRATADRGADRGNVDRPRPTPRMAASPRPVVERETLPPREPPAATAAIAAPASPPPQTQPASPPPAAAKAPAPPAAAMPAPTPVAKPAANDPPSPALITARKEIADGYRLLRAGFVKKARERFDAGMTAASGEATLGIARSMDPTYLKGVAFPDAEPDVEEARKLYRRAILLGNSEAKNDLERLEAGTATAQPAAPPATTQPQ